jgi:hypothetical protein
MIFVTLKNEGTVESLPGIASRWKEVRKQSKRAEEHRASLH